MKLRYICASTTLALLSLAPIEPTAAQGIPVVDAQNIAQQVANHVETIAKYVEQIAVLRDQLVSARAQVASLTGTRSLGDILNNPAIRNSLPSNIQDIWRDLESTSSRLTSAIDNVLDEEKSKRTGDWSVDRESLATRLERLRASAKVLTEQAYTAQQARLTQLDSLQAQINLTTDPKGIAELQARIQVEQANITADQTRTKLLADQLAAEEQVILSQQRSLTREMFSTANPVRLPSQ